MSAVQARCWRHLELKKKAFWHADLPLQMLEFVMKLRKRLKLISIFPWLQFCSKIWETLWMIIKIISKSLHDHSRYKVPFILAFIFQLAYSANLINFNWINLIFVDHKSAFNSRLLVDSPFFSCWTLIYGTLKCCLILH